MKINLLKSTLKEINKDIKVVRTGSVGNEAKYYDVVLNGKVLKRLKTLSCHNFTIQEVGAGKNSHQVTRIIKEITEEIR